MRKLMRWMHHNTFGRFRNWQLRQLHRALYAANSEQERDEIINWWWIRRRITMIEDHDFSRAYGIWSRVRWFDRWGNTPLSESMWQLEYDRYYSDVAFHQLATSLSITMRGSAFSASDVTQAARVAEHKLAELKRTEQMLAEEQP